MTRLACAIALTLGLSGCASLLTTETAEHVFMLQGTSAPHISARAGEVPIEQRPSLSVQVVTVAPGLGTDDIMARDGQRLTPIRNIRWVESAPLLVEKQVTSYLESSGLFSYVTHQRGGPRTDLMLVADLRGLYVNLDGSAPESVTVALSARLVEGIRSQPLANLNLSEQQPLLSSDKEALAQAFHNAAEAIMLKLQNEIERALLNP